MASNELIETLRDAQRLGFFGSRPIEEAIEHSQAFVSALGELAPGLRLVDLGSGGGLPGLVLADAYPNIEIVLVDRRAKRTDFLARAVSRLRMAHVTVRGADTAALAGEVSSGTLPCFDVVTARGFGPPAFTLRTAVALVADAGRVVVSEPPSGERWDAELLADLGLRAGLPGRVRVFTRFT